MPLADSNGPRWIRAQNAATEKRSRGLGPVRDFLLRLFGRTKASENRAKPQTLGRELQPLEFDRHDDRIGFIPEPGLRAHDVRRPAPRLGVDHPDVFAHDTKEQE